MRPIASVLCALGLTLGASAAFPNVVYNLSGTFKPPTSAAYTVLLGNGSFDGTVTLPGSAFPTSGTTSFVSFVVNLRNSAGILVDTMTKGVAGGGGYFSSTYASLYGGPVLEFYDSVGDYLQLVVPTGFDGDGAILANGNSYAQVASSANQGTVAAGMLRPASAVARIAEPSTVSLAALGGVLLLRLCRRRRTRTGRFFAPEPIG